MFMHGVTVVSGAFLSKPLRLEVSVKNAADHAYTKVVLLSHDSSVFECAFHPARKLVDSGTITVCILEPPKLRIMKPSVKATARFTYADAQGLLKHPKPRSVKGFDIHLHLSQEREPFRDLLDASREISSQMASLLGRLGKAKKPIESSLGIVTALSELNPVANAILKFVNVAYKHLQTQAETDTAIRDLADDLHSAYGLIQAVRGIATLAFLRETVERAKKLFEDAADFIVAYCSRKATSRALHAMISSTEQDALKSLQKRFLHLKDHFAQGVAAETLIEVKHVMEHHRQHSYSSGVEMTPLLRASLPKKPRTLRGRLQDLESIITILSRTESTYVSILGDGGMGKTTLALWVLHDARLNHRYGSRRFFVACDAITSASLLLTEIANALRIPLCARTPTTLLDVILGALGGGPAVLCLDGFETVWESRGTRREVEDVLCALADTDGLSIIVTIRGTQRPADSHIAWSHVPSLPPLSFLDSKGIFEERSQKSMDGFAERLIQAMDGIPLALTLLGTLAQENSGETTETLWERWSSEGPSLAENGGCDRSSSLDMSISLSVYGQRMLEHPEAADILAILSLLPDGLSTSKEILSALKANLLDSDSLHRAITTLRRVALVYEVAPDTSTARGYLRLLSPIRQWCLAHLKPSEITIHALMRTYIDFINSHGQYENEDTYALVFPELMNCKHILLYAYHSGYQHPDLTTAALRFTHWLEYVNDYCEQIVTLVVQKESDPGLLGSAHQAKGQLQLRRGSHEEAMQSSRTGLKLHVEARDVSKQGDVFRWIGWVYTALYSLADAETAFQRALDIHRGVHNLVGQAFDLQALGDLYVERYEFQAAEGMLTMALRLVRDLNIRLDEANVLLTMGRVHIGLLQLDAAAMDLTTALGIYRQLHDAYGEAQALHCLGRTSLAAGQLKDAEQHFMEALQLHRRADDDVGTGDDLDLLGRVCLERDALDEAESHFAEALKLYQRAHDTSGEGSAREGLGRVSLGREELDIAERYFAEAKTLHGSACNLVGEGDALVGLGRIHARLGQLGEAKMCFKAALKIHQRAQCFRGQEESRRCLRQLPNEVVQANLSKKSIDSAHTTFRLGSYPEGAL